MDRSIAAGPDASSGAKVPADNPIDRPEQDTLGRASAASAFAQQLLTLDASKGAVAAVLGAWGSGKTSFLNLAQRQLKQHGLPVVEFNPWMFSGTEQLVEAFFQEIAAQLRVKEGFSQIADRISDYGEALSGLGWVPLVGPWIERARLAFALLKLSVREKASKGRDLRGRRENIEAALIGIDKPVIIIIDDIDRLTAAEMKSLFKLVRLVASFPNVIYVLAFDRVRVEAAISDEAIPGREYLEKILQLALDLPELSPEVLPGQIFSALDVALKDVPSLGHLDAGAWADIFAEVVRPLLRNMRDVRRYVLAVRGAAASLGGQVALVDILGLEAIRTFLPDVYRKLSYAVGPLTDVEEDGRRDKSLAAKSKVESIIAAGAPTYASVARAMIARQFPAAKRHIDNVYYGRESRAAWLRERRVAHASILRFYLERIVGQQLSTFSLAEAIFPSMTDASAFRAALRTLPRERLEDVIAALEPFEDLFTEEQLEPSLETLLNIIPSLPERQLGMFDFAPKTVVLRIVYRLMRKHSPNILEKAVRQVLPRLQSLSSKAELISMVGHRQGVGQELVSETSARELEASWRAEVRGTGNNVLAKEHDLLRIMIDSRQHAEAGEPIVELNLDPPVTLALLKSAFSETRMQMMGGREIKREPRLAWDLLVEVVGGEHKLVGAIEMLDSVWTPENEKFIVLARNYASGWRPDDP